MKDAIDITEYIETDNKDYTLIPNDFFGNRTGNTTNLVIGSGKGKFIKEAALFFPDENFIGIEKAWKYGKISIKRLKKEKVNNVKIIINDVIKVIDKIQDKSIDNVHIYFPDPWFKRRHFKRRIITDRFIEQLYRIIVPTGRIHFRTDFEDYFTLYPEIITKNNLFRRIEFTDNKYFDIKTSFETKYSKENRNIYIDVFTKVR